MRDLLLLYASDGDPADLPATRDFGTFLAWRARQDETESARVWAAELAGVEEPTLPAPGADGVGADGVDQIEIPLPADEAREAHPARRRVGASPSTPWSRGAWALLLGGLTGRQDVVFGATVSGRPRRRARRRCDGRHVHQHPARTRRVRPRRHPHRDLTRLQSRQAGLMEHHYYGLTEIQQTVGLPSLFDTLVVFESYPVDKEGLGAAADAADGITFTGLRRRRPPTTR
ncbi:condensation domain-containing protein [Streptomyces sp. KL116D]|uniref:condensation domain-containing protein n=1 Tax=Streptomyces sp. KL116D TaxID=3045152 RepID=UPI00355811ED